MRVLLVEHWGRGSLIVLQGDGLRLAAFVEKAATVAIGTEAAVDVRLERSLLFDADSGKNLGYAEGK